MPRGPSRPEPAQCPPGRGPNYNSQRAAGTSPGERRWSVVQSCRKRLPSCWGWSGPCLCLRTPWPTSSLSQASQCARALCSLPGPTDTRALSCVAPRGSIVASFPCRRCAAVMGHCQRRGSQLLLGQECHLHVYEQGGVAQIAGVHSHPLPDLPHGTLDLAELERMVTRGLGSPYHPVCELICLENTHSSSGGRVLPLDYLRQVHHLARTYGVRVHLDGARLMNAAVALHVSPARIVEHCDSVSLCFSKVGKPLAASRIWDRGGARRSQPGSPAPVLAAAGPGPLQHLPRQGPVPFPSPSRQPQGQRGEPGGAGRQDSLLSSSQGLGAPVGALVGGPKDFIEGAWRLRKALGGGMRQAGVLAAAALVGLADAEEVLLRDHQNAQRFARGAGVPHLLRGRRRRGDERGDGDGGRAGARGALPASAGRERCRGGPDRACGARAAVPLERAVGARRVAPRRLRAGHRAGAEEVGVRAEAAGALSAVSGPCPCRRRVGGAGVLREQVAGEAVSHHPATPLSPPGTFSSHTRGQAFQQSPGGSQRRASAPSPSHLLGVGQLMSVSLLVLGTPEEG
ncbi:unnamed protein product [Nyctereutes procyonoides]|uniref:(raccoon dog) hypothetical protein n=1 Tax=Nyctereutes procyonoides TaxID=34880 RepID=A0A811XXY4_NYCPR|nr:unnamed protein product [Nyctereutes procyonoides]